MATVLETTIEAAGRASGWLLAPAVAAATRLRGRRLLHADGQIYTADALADTRDPRLRPLADRLAGAALVRLSAALWSREWPDVLGMTLRFFGRPRVRPESPSLQDVLLATVPSLLGFPLALARTDPHDFLSNRYYALAPFEADGIGRVRVRACWPGPAPEAPGRFERLMAAVATDAAELSFEVLPEGGQEWSGLLRVRLRVPAALDEHRTRFSPFNDRGGLRPTGFLHALRRGPYSAGQAARGAQPRPMRTSPRSSTRR